MRMLQLSYLYWCLYVFQHPLKRSIYTCLHLVDNCIYGKCKYIYNIYMDPIWVHFRIPDIFQNLRHQNWEAAKASVMKYKIAAVSAK